MKTFEKAIPQNILNISNKTRANLFTWRGQFSPQLVEAILDAYCFPNSIILDPFVGSGTVLLEAGKSSLEAYGCDLNPAAFLLSKTYEFINNIDRKKIINKIREKLDKEFPYSIFQKNQNEFKNLDERLLILRNGLDKEEQILVDALIILLDIYHNIITNDFIQAKFFHLVNLIENLPYSDKKIKTDLSDARQLSLEDNQIDFVITSPPYINVFNYHQNYRKSAEILGWDLLKIARSEIGSNRANRGNPHLRSKDQDFILGKKLYLKTSFEANFQNYQLIESCLGYVCAECKTNLDKTMFQEAVATSKDLKIAAPNSLYFLICEFLDMTPVSIISTQIDDVLIVRKSKRMSANMRQKYQTAETRKKNRSEYQDFLVNSQYYPDVFQRMIDKIQTLIDDTNLSVEKVLNQGHF